LSPVNPEIATPSLADDPPVKRSVAPPVDRSAAALAGASSWRSAAASTELAAFATEHYDRLLRVVTLSVALAILAACGLIEPLPPPPGTVKVQVVVRNLSDTPVEELGVKVRGGMLAGAAQPTSVPPQSTTTVTFYVPVDEEWWVGLNGVGVLTGEEVRRRLPGCAIEFSTNLHFNCP
jgi:predicted small lipoprotein YifL